MEGSPLATLAPELRNRIYEFVFDTEYAVTLKDDGMQHALTKTCRRLREETLELYYSLAKLNAHLDDGPSTPVAKWLKKIGPKNVLLLNEINVWDLHMKNATIYGHESTQRLLNSCPADGKKYSLQPTGTWLMNQGWYLKAVVIALHSMGLELRNLGKTASVPGYKVEMTSDFAMVPRSDASAQFAERRPELEAFPEFRDLLAHLGFTEDMLEEAADHMTKTKGFAEGCKEIRMRRGRRDIFLYFTDGMFTSIRQTFIPREEEFTPF
jgi:hypothetical protein